MPPRTSKHKETSSNKDTKEINPIKLTLTLQNVEGTILYKEQTTVQEFHKLMDPLFDNIKEIGRSATSIIYRGA